MWLKDPGSKIIGAFKVERRSLLRLPPFSIIIKVLQQRKKKKEKSTGIILVPEWTEQPWQASEITTTYFLKQDSPSAAQEAHPGVRENIRHRKCLKYHLSQWTSCCLTFGHTIIIEHHQVGLFN